MTTKIHSELFPLGWFSYLIHPTPTEEVHKSWWFRGNGWNFILSSTKGRFHKTQEDSERDLLKKVSREVKRLEENTDLKPSQVRRLQILKSAIP